jgi:hypothetical protein
MRRVAFAVMILGLIGLGCDSTTQNPFIVRVSDINNGGSTLLSDVIHIDEQDSSLSVPTELVPVILTNRRYAITVAPDVGTAWYDFQVKRFTVRWRWSGPPLPGVDLTQFNHTEETAIIVPFNGEATLFALVVPISMKTTPPFAGLAFGGGSIALVADIEITGAPAIDLDDEIQVPTSLSVSFADFADQQ